MTATRRSRARDTWTPPIGGDAPFTGGTAVGKIVAYEMSGQGDSGTLIGTVMMACTIGRGGSLVVDPGAETYADDYADGYTLREGEHFVVIDDEVTYTEFGQQTPDDDGVDFASLTTAVAVQSAALVNGVSAQEAKLNEVGLLTNNPYQNATEAIEALTKVPTKFQLTMLPLAGGPFETVYNVTLSELMVPKTIELEGSV